MGYYNKMGYYKKRPSNISWATIIICFILILLINFSGNLFTASKWNNGYCPECETRYELRSVYRGTKYYSCPDCGQEVTRY